MEPDLKDGENGSRGMAIKVLDVNGTILFPDKDPASDKTGQNQDFLMVNTPEFAFANVRDYLRLTRILTLGMGPGPYFIPLKGVEMGVV